MNKVNEEIKTLKAIEDELYIKYPKDTLNKDRKIKLKSAKLYLKQLIELNQFFGDVDLSLRILIGGKEMKINWMDNIINDLLASGELSEDSIFIKYKKGRPEMKRLIKHAHEAQNITIEKIDNNYVITGLK